MQKKIKSKRYKPVLWVTDPWHMLDHPRDTTLRLVEEALKLGIPCSWCNVRTLRLEDGKVLADIQKFLDLGSDRSSESIQLGPSESLSLGGFPIIHFRTDPPVDGGFLHPLQLIALGAPKAQVVNPLPVLFSLNEKFETAFSKGLMPPSVVSSQWEKLKQFGEKHKKTVLKPLNEAESRGVKLLNWETSDGIKTAESELKEATQNQRQLVILQKYLPGIAEGEKRLWFLDGNLIAFMRKHPIPGDFKVDIDRGSRIGITELTKTEKKKARLISSHLKKRKIRLAAVDIIEDLVTDFNFTSPGLIVQLENLLGENLARRIVLATCRAK